MEKERIIEIISEHPWMYEKLSKEERADADITLAAVSADGMQIAHAINPTVKSIKTALLQNQNSFMVLPFDIQTKDLALRVLRLDALDGMNDAVFLPKYLMATYPDDADIAIAVMQNNWDYYRSAPKALEENPIVALEAVRHNGLLLQYVPDSLKQLNDIYSVSAVKQNPLAIAYVPKEQLNDSLIMLAVKRNGMAIAYVPDYMITEEIAKVAVRNNPAAKKHIPIPLRIKNGAKRFVQYVLRNAPDKVRYYNIHPGEVVVFHNKRKLINEMTRRDENLHQNWFVFKHASRKLRNDKEVALTAVRINGKALEYASPELQNDKDVVLTAVEYYGCALRFASPELQNDKDVVMKAIMDDGYALQFASQELQNDKDIVKIAYKKAPGSLKYASQKIQEGIKKYGYAYFDMSDKPKDFSELMKIAADAKAKDITNKGNVLPNKDDEKSADKKSDEDSPGER